MFILGSKSPRRKSLLEEAGLKFEVYGGDLDESIDEKDPEELVKKLSYLKAKQISQKFKGKWILSADTVVVIDGKILEKPQSKDDAKRMISLLSGNIHEVLTGFTIMNDKEHITEFVRTKVIFRDLLEDEKEWYVSTEEPYDKAGGYAIQGIGTFMVKGIEGSYSNVVGLPVAEVIENLLKLKIIKREIGKDSYSSY